MKKFTICAVLAAAAMLSGAKASASVFEANDNSLSIRPVLSLDITCPGDTKIDDLLKLDAFKSGAGLSFGAVVDVPVWMNMYLESGLKFYYHTAKYNKDFFDIAFDDDDLKPSSGSIREFGVSIPVLVGYHFDFDPVRLHVFTGPEFNIGFSGKTHLNYTLGNHKVSESESIYDGLRRGDVAWVIGAGVQYERAMFTISAHPGMVNWSKNDGMHLDRTNVDLGISYFFNL